MSVPKTEWNKFQDTFGTCTSHRNLNFCLFQFRVASVCISMVTFFGLGVRGFFPALLGTFGRNLVESRKKCS